MNAVVVAKALAVALVVALWVGVALVLRRWKNADPQAHFDWRGFRFPREMAYWLLLLLSASAALKAVILLFAEVDERLG